MLTKRLTKRISARAEAINYLLAHGEDPAAGCTMRYAADAGGVNSYIESETAITAKDLDAARMIRAGEAEASPTFAGRATAFLVEVQS